jgi:putative protease
MTMPASTAAKPEILAPAGSLESFFAALEAGADAVYVGLKDFSARAKAANFTLAELAQMVSYAHHHKRSIYVTLNTLVKEEELPQLVETLAVLEEIGVDAVILQDLAIWRLARDHFPGLALHSSTQMTVHNIAGVRMLERMGFSRAVLARELTLEEIAALRRQTTMELEHFIHGALCFSFSGQCYFSSWLGGKSGNRGRCAQPCRRHYRYRHHEGYYFSTNDLSAIDLLPELAAAGVISFKIEGRMKSAEYVASVVGAYRKVLDAAPAERPAAIRQGKDLLKLSFGRLPTKGFLAGAAPTDIAIPSLKGATGRFLGEITAVRGPEVSFRTKDRIHLGDRLRIQPKTDQSGSAFTVKELRLGKGPAKIAPAGSSVSIPTPFHGRFKVGDTVFKVSSEQAFTMSAAACRRKLAAAGPAPVPVNIDVSLTGGILTVQGQAGGASLRRDYPVATTPAETSPLSAETLQGVFARVGEEPFVLTEFRTGQLPAVVVPPSRLKEVRRDFYRALSDAFRTERGRRTREHLEQARAALLPALDVRAPNEREITVAVRDLRDAHILNDQSVRRLLVPLSPGTVQGLAAQGRRLRGREKSVVWDIPFVILDTDWPVYRELVRRLAAQGFSAFRLNNLGHFALFDGLEGLTLIGSYRLFTLNSQAALAWKELGLAEVTLYLEDDRANLRALLRRETGLARGLTVYGQVPLIVSRIPVRAVRADQPVLSDRGDAYRVQSRGGLTVLSSETDFSLLGRLRELQDMGCGRFTVDLSHLGPFSKQGKEVMEAVRRDSPITGTSTFNYDLLLE